MTEPAPLHPALARVAVAYDELCMQWSTKQITGTEAKARMHELVARDDTGVMWKIDPESGQWVRRTRAGDWMPGTPPTSGLVLPTPHDLTGTDRLLNPDSRVTFTPIDDRLLSPPAGLVGATRHRPAVRSTPMRPMSNRRKVIGVVCLLAALALGRAGWNAVADEGAPATTPAPASSSTPKVTPKAKPKPAKVVPKPAVPPAGRG